MRTLPEVVKLDSEWVSLVEEAKAMGMSIEEVREYIKRFSNER